MLKKNNFYFIAACRRFNSRHSAENMSAKLKEILDEFGILNKTFLLITDSAKNMEKCKLLIKFIVC